jgi:CPA1 family monovalent cation:H+ antiporter
LIVVTAVTAVIVIVARFVWIYPATYLPRWLIPPLARRDPSPPWQQVFILGFTGVRGVVSLAAALAIPLTIESGAPFPHRDVILFATFGIIVITLVGQGMMLPSVIGWLGIGHHGKAEHRREQEAELAARKEVLRASRRHLKKLAAERNLSPETIAALDARHDHRERLIPSDLDGGLEAIHLSNNVRLELIAAEREFLQQLLRDGKITDESRRRLERDLDLEEAAILARREGETPL